MTVIQRHGPYCFGSDRGLDRVQMELLANSFNLPAQQATGVLGGRTQPMSLEIDRYGPVLIKAYFRGGIAGRLNLKTYLGPGPCRGQAEFEMLKKVRSLDINAPEPVAFALRGHMLKQTWLMTRMLTDSITLSQLCSDNPQAARQVMALVTAQVRKLIKNRILHVDLHPGNILIKGSQDAYIIDFDKAVVKKQGCSGLGRRYASRWRRAVKKHRLPSFIDDTFRSGLGDDLEKAS